MRAIYNLGEPGAWEGWKRSVSRGGLPRWTGERRVEMMESDVWRGALKARPRWSVMGVGHGWVSQDGSVWLRMTHNEFAPG